MDFGKLISGYDLQGKTVIFGDGRRRICYGPVSRVANGAYGTYFSVRHAQVLKTSSAIARQLPTKTIFITNQSRVTDNQASLVISYGHGIHPKTIILTATTDPSQIKELAKNLLC